MKNTEKREMWINLSLSELKAFREKVFKKYARLHHTYMSLSEEQEKRYFYLKDMLSQIDYDVKMEETKEVSKKFGEMLTKAVDVTSTILNQITEETKMTQEDQMLRKAKQELYYWYKSRDRSNFTAMLYTIIAKADAINREKLRLSYPYEVEVMENFQNKAGYWEEVEKLIEG